MIVLVLVLCIPSAGCSQRTGKRGYEKYGQRLGLYGGDRRVPLFCIKKRCGYREKAGHTPINELGQETFTEDIPSLLDLE